MLPEDLMPTACATPHKQLNIDAAKELRFYYLNHRGEWSLRRVLPRYICFGVTKFYTTPQNLYVAWDLDRNEQRTFAQDRMFNASLPLYSEFFKSLAEGKS